MIIELTEEVKHYMRLKREAEDKLDTILDSMGHIRELIRDIEIYKEYIENQRGYNETEH